MATIQNVNLANTFGEWINVTNATVNEVNSLTACNYTKSTGTLYLNDPTLGLSVLANTYLTGNVEVSATGTLIVRKNIEVQNTIFLTNKTTGSKSNNVVLEANGVANIAYVNITGTGAAANVTNNFRVGGTSTFVGAVSGTSGSFTGVVTVPTAATGTSNTMIATTAYVQTTNTSMKTYVDSQNSTLTSYINSINNSYLPLKANTASPTFTGMPLSPTAATSTSNTMIATTAFVQDANTKLKSYTDATHAPLISPALTGTPTTPTAATGTSNTMIATTAFVQTANTNMKSLVDLKAPLLSPTLTTPTLTYASLSAGTSTAGQSPLKFTSGTLLTSVEAGATEYDGNHLYVTPGSTGSGRSVVAREYFCLNSTDKSLTLNTQTDLFSSAQVFTMAANKTYFFDYYLTGGKGATAGTNTYQAVCGATVSQIFISVINGNTGTPASHARAASVASLLSPATASITANLLWSHIVRVMVVTSASTTFKLQCNSAGSAGTCYYGSFYTVKELPGSNVGTFA